MIRKKPEKVYPMNNVRMKNSEKDLEIFLNFFFSSIKTMEESVSEWSLLSSKLGWHPNPETTPFFLRSPWKVYLRLTKLVLIYSAYYHFLSIPRPFCLKYFFSELNACQNFITIMMSSLSQSPFCRGNLGVTLQKNDILCQSRSDSLSEY